MKKTLLFTLLILLPTMYCSSQGDPGATELWKPVPVKVEPGKNGSAPSDALILFDGHNLSKFESVKGGDAKWNIEHGVMTVLSGSGNIRTREKFGDCQLHIEWRSPEFDVDEGQDKGNSGIFLMGRYEIQVLDSYTNKTYVNGQAGAIYKQYIPLVNATRRPGEWQTYDIIFIAPKFGKSGGLISPARLTVLHNGVLIQNNVSLIGPTEYIGEPVYVEHDNAEALILQDHGDLVSYRNIWIREL